MRAFETVLSIKEMKDVCYLVDAFKNIDCDMDLMTEYRRYIVDAKSLLGVFSLDLTCPLILRAYTDDAETVRQIRAVIQKLGAP